MSIIIIVRLVLFKSQSEKNHQNETIPFSGGLSGCVRY